MFTITPKLPSRQNLVDKFSMYMTLENNKVRLTIKWKTDPHLQSNIELYKSRHKKFASLFNQENNRRDLVQFWIDMALNDLPVKEEWEPEKRVQNAWKHLSVYCEESCYWAAEKLSSDVWKEDKYQSWEEYLFFARCLIYNDNKFRYILAKYNSNNYSLDTHLTTVLINAIKDEAAVAKFSKWRLLHKKIDKELKEALVRAGRYEPEISRFLFARKYFKQVYQMNKIQNPAKIIGKKWQEPDSVDFALSANYYNAEKLLPSAPHEVAVGAFVTGEQIKVWMEICIIALQNYPKSITPHFSLEALQETGREAEAEDYPDLEQDLPTYGIEDSALNQVSLASKTEAVLQQDLFSLKAEQQEILLLYYGFDLNQKQIADKFKVTQGAIARRLKTIELKLLKTLSRLSQPPEWVSQYVALWLVRNYQTPIYSDLIHVAMVEAIKKLEPQEQELLRLAYGQKLDEQIIANQLGISQLKLMDTLRRNKSALEAALIKEIDNFINKYLQYWLPKVSKTVVKSACDNLGFSRSGAASLKTMNAVLKESLKILHSSK